VSKRELKQWEPNNLDVFHYYGRWPSNRSPYFHIPFCQDICTFCPFYREILSNDELLDAYVKAIIKKKLNLNLVIKMCRKNKLQVFFLEGGTPSLLKPEHIRKIGLAIHKYFNLSELKEFSFEMNAKTITKDRVEALKEIGVTYGRMGVQTFNPKYRKIFQLSATPDQVEHGVALLNENFPFVCIDMLYGFHGQSIDDFLKDLHFATSLNTKTIDVYPINNVVIQKRLDDAYQAHNFQPASGLTKFSMNILLNEYMRNNGYLPHNGHGYIKTKYDLTKNNPVVSDEYTFQYHETVYGYEGYEVIGFGRSASFLLDGAYLYNCNDTVQYVKGLLGSNKLDIDVEVYSKELCKQRGLILHLPYHGIAKKQKINLDLIHEEIFIKLQNAIERGLVIETPNDYQLTKKGWYWYVNLLFYLAADTDHKAMKDYIETNRTGDLGKWQIDWTY